MELKGFHCFSQNRLTISNVTDCYVCLSCSLYVYVHYFYVFFIPTPTPLYPHLEQIMTIGIRRTINHVIIIMIIPSQLTFSESAIAVSSSKVEWT